jgi:hypothetical protein
VCGWLPEAELERERLSAKERNALYNATAKLQALGPALAYLHTSAVPPTAGFRELRPRAGRSGWRVLHRQVGDRFVIAAVAPGAKDHPQGFTWACAAAEERFNELNED